MNGAVDITKVYFIRDAFPLNCDDEFVDLIKELTTKIQVFIYNMLHGTCFRTFCKLVKYAEVILVKLKN
jgi:hypothetical protein